MNFQDPDISAPVLQLAALLKNSEPGLASWHAACERIYQIIARPERARIRQELVAAIAEEAGPDVPKPVLAVIIHRVMPLGEG